MRKRAEEERLREEKRKAHEEEKRKKEQEGLKAQQLLEEELARRRKEIDHKYSGMEETPIWDAKWRSKTTPTVKPTQEPQSSHPEPTHKEPEADREMPKED